MSTFHQSCPGCGRALELPADAKGRLGQCPACETTFTIGEVAGADKESSSDLIRPVETSDPIAEPIASPWQTFPATRPLQISECSIEEILSITLSIFSARWRSCILPLLIVVSATLFLVVLPLVILDAIKQAGAKGLAGIGYLLLLPVVFAVSVICSIGVARVAIAMARNEAAPLARFIAPVHMLLRAAGIALLASVVIGVICMVMLGFVATVNAAGGKGLGRIPAFLSGVAILVLAFGLAWQLWAALLVCADDKGTAFGSIRASQAIATRNRLTSFFLVLIALVLLLLGTLMGIIGNVVTAPLTILMFAVSYLLMTGQDVADPRDR